MPLATLSNMSCEVIGFLRKCGLFLPILLLVSPSGMVETPRLQAKHVCHSEAEPKNLNALTETLRFAQGDSLGGGFERVGFQPTCIEPLGLKPRVVQLWT